MSARRRIVRIVALGLALVPAGGLALSDAAAETEVPLRAALGELARDGVEVVWSEALVPGAARSPRPDADLPLADRFERLLEPHALAAIRGPSGGWIVVRRTAPEARARLVVEVRSRAGAPLAGAEVFAAGRRISTDALGLARFEGLVAGEIVVEVRLRGFAIEEGLRVRVQPAGEARLEVRLDPVPEAGTAIVVTPSRYALFGEPAPLALGRSREELARVPHFGDDPLRVAGRLPGTAAGDFSSPFSVRGGEPREVAIRLDGLVLERPYHLPDLQALFSALDPAIVGAMELHTGGYPVDLGGHLSGILDVTTREPGRRRALELGIGLLAAHALTGGSTAGGTHWLLSLRRGYLDLVVPRVDTGGDLEPTYADLFGKLEWPLGRRARLALSTLATDDRELFTGEEEGDERLEGTADSLALWGRLDTGLGEAGWGRISLAATRHSRGAEGYVQFGDSNSDDWRRAESLALLLDGGLALERHELRVGVEARRVEARYRHDSLRVIDDPILLAFGIPPLTERHARLAPSGEAIEAYLADRVRFGERVALEVGVRFSRWTWTGDHRTTPRVHLVVAATPALDLRATWGTFAQPRAIDELEVEDGIETFPRAETAEHRILGLDGRVGARGRLRLELYEKIYRDIATRFENLYDPIQLFPALEADRVRVDSERGRARGAEISWARRGGRRLDLDLAYAWSRAEDRVEGRWQRRRFDQQHAVTGALALRLGERWSIALAGLYHTGWPTTAVWLERVEAPDGGPQLVPRLGERNAIDYPDYHRLDLRVARRFETKRGELEVALDLYNLYSRDNVCCVREFLVVPSGDGAPDLMPDYDTWLPLVPSFGVIWRRR